MKRSEIAKYLGVHPSQITRQLNDGATITYATAQKYSEKLGIPWAEVMSAAMDGRIEELLNTLIADDVSEEDTPPKVSGELQVDGNIKR